MSCKFDFTGWKILVTGASRGIGRGIALALCQANAEVVAMARDLNALKQLRQESNKKIAIVMCDVTSGRANIESVLEPFQPFNGLVNSAGIAMRHDFLDMKEDDFKRIMDTNVIGASTVSQVVAKGMIDRKVKGSKSIVHISSQVSLVTTPHHTAYTASKCALDGVCRSMAQELAPFQIRVNTVNPTVVMTDMGREAWDNDSQRSVDMRKRIPLNRWAEVDEVVNSVLWLLADTSGMTTGVSLPVDGGATIS